MYVIPQLGSGSVCCRAASVVRSVRTTVTVHDCVNVMVIHRAAINGFSLFILFLYACTVLEYVVAENETTADTCKIYIRSHMYVHKHGKIIMKDCCLVLYM